ncbi:MAG: DNA circularization N-terminal domain-containing protein [Spirochaetes bacterium]|nr:DNA circularization N-terminal domain-containing protein [Spirochaetota bacterium]
MGWRDRLIDAAITTPDKKRFKFQYQDVEKTIDKKTSTYEFAEKDGALVQDFGLGKVSYPLTIFFSGEDYDLEAKRFEKSASKKGVCSLEHPVYGIKDVVIVKIQRRDSLQSAGNQAVFNLDMTETIIPESPILGVEAISQVMTGIESMTDLAASTLEGVATFAYGLVSGIQQMAQTFINSAMRIFDAAVSVTDTAAAAFSSTANFINKNIDALALAPAELSRSLQTLILAPSQLPVSVKSRMAMYSDLLGQVLSDPMGANTREYRNQCLMKQMLATAILTAMADVNLHPDTGTNTGFTTRADAIQSAASLVNTFLEVQGFLDGMETTGVSNDLENRFAASDALIQALKRIISSTARYLIQLSYELKQERIVTLDRDRTIIDLCYELYGTTANDYLDLLIVSNSLTATEILLIPRAREIRYYI